MSMHTDVVHGFDFGMSIFPRVVHPSKTRFKPWYVKRVGAVEGGVALAHL